MSRKSLLSRVLSVIVSVVMVVSMTPVAWAAESGDATRGSSLLAQIKASYAQAVTDAEQAQAEADAAQAEYKAASETLDALVNDPTVIEAKARVAETGAALDSAQQTYDTAKGALDTARENYNGNLAAVAAAEETLAAAQERKAAADANVPATQQALTDAQAAYEEAKSALDAAQAAYDSAFEQAAIQAAKGSFGFFEYVGATDALSVLTDSTYASYTVQGDPEDATSLDNMRNTIQWIRECNRLRVSRDQGVLTVNDTLMAMAQADANYSDVNIGHAQQFNVGENLAWNYSNPFNGWYDREKQVFDGYVESGDYPNLKQYEFNAYGAYQAYPSIYGSIGHYINIINSSYTNTGFAICTRGSNYKITHCQVFSSGSGMSVDDYEARFMEYYDSVAGDNVAKKEADALAEAEATFALKQTALEEAQAAAAAAVEEQQAAATALTQAQADYDTLSSETSSLKDAYDAAIEDFERADAALTVAQSAYEEAVAAFDAVDNSEQVVAAEAALASATQRKDAADAALAASRETEASTFAALTEATDLTCASFTGIERTKRYDGTPQTQDGLSITKQITFGSDSETYTLECGVDYTVAYSDNIEPGTVTMTIDGAGDFAGTRTFTYEIIKSPVKTDGTAYRIVSASDSDFILDVAEVHPTAGANVSIWTSNGGPNQLFTFEQTAAGDFVIRNVANPELVLDAEGAFPEVGANVSTWTYNGGRNQEWSFVDTRDGHYIIVNVGNPTLWLDAAGAEPEIGANVGLWYGNGGLNQQWAFVEANDLAYADVTVVGLERNATGSELSPDCTVTLNNIELVQGVDYDLLFDGVAAAPISVGTYDVAIAGKGDYIGSLDLGEFTIYPAPVMKNYKSPYHVVSGFSDDFVLDVAEAQPTIGANVSIWVDNNGNNQRFTIELGDDGFYVLRNVANPKLVLDAAGAVPEVGANVSTWSFNEGMNQKWVLLPSEKMEGYYRIASASNTAFVLDAAGAEPEIGANVSIWYDNSGLNQLWKMVSAIPGSISAPLRFGMADNSSFVLEVDELVAGANVSIGVDNGSANQMFITEATPEMNNIIRCAANPELVLEVAGSPESGANLVLGTYNGGDNQRWISRTYSGDPSTYIASVANERIMLSCSGEVPEEGAKVFLSTYNAELSQRWLRIPVE